jgi:lysozyme
MAAAAYLDICRTQLPIDEGRPRRAYRDSVGIWTVGIGRNLEAVEFTDGEIALMFANDLVRADNLAHVLVVNFEDLSEARKAVVVNMAFNLGPRLGAFHKFLEAIRLEDWATAAAEMEDSLWHRQVGGRALRLEEAMREG